LALNGVIENELKEMVFKVTPPGGKVAYLSTGVGKVIPVHKVLPVVENKTSDVEVTYIVTKKEVKRMKKMLLVPLVPLPDLDARSRLNEREVSSKNEKKDDDSGTEEESDADDTGDEEEAKETCLTEDGKEISELSSLVREPSTSCTKYC
jgi:nitric oxide reductase activation protein